MTLDELAAAFHRMVESRFFGKYAGVVTDVQDPLGIARIRARVPEVYGEDTASGWALPSLPFGGGANRGMYVLPDVGDTVWIEFEAGDVSRPIWAGTFWGAPGSTGGQDDLGTASGAEVPDAADDPARPGQHVIRTSAGHVISLDDDGGVVVVAEAQGAEVRITAQGEITLKADTILLGDGAGQKLVLGDAFQTLFNSHTHPTGVGPSGPPAQPMTARHLSRVSKTK